MDRYIGTIVVNAKPMTRIEYNAFRNWQLPADENGDDEGYLVEYAHANHVSWMPADVFERVYRKIVK